MFVKKAITFWILLCFVFQQINVFAGTNNGTIGVYGSTDGNARLIFKGTFVPKKIESLLKKYIGEYVTCKMCKSPDTDLVKEQASRLFFVQCNSCGARRTVATISKGFVATQRGERRAMRNK